MKYFLTRRHFFKLTVGVVPALLASVRYLEKKEERDSFGSENEEFVMWNGWVLKKSDLKHLV